MNKIINVASFHTYLSDITAVLNLWSGTACVLYLNSNRPCELSMISFLISKHSFFPNIGNTNQHVDGFSQHYFMRRPDVWLTKPFLIQCGRIVSWTHNDTLQCHCTRNRTVCFQENVCEMSSILFRPQCVDENCSSMSLYIHIIPTAIYAHIFEYNPNNNHSWSVWKNLRCSPLFNSSPPSTAWMRQWTGSALVQIMACRLIGAKPLAKPMLTYCQLDP